MGDEQLPQGDNIFNPPEPVPPTPPQSKKLKWWAWLLISIAIIAVVGVVAAAVYMKKNVKKPNIGQEGADTQLMDEEETFEVDKP